MRRLITIAAVALFAFCLTACDGEGASRPPQVTVRVVHAAPTFPDIDFLREEVVEAPLGYGSGAVLTFDSGQYDFNLEISPIGAPNQRLLSFSENLASAMEHFIVISASAGTLMPIVVAAPEIDSTSASGQLVVVQAAEVLGSVDVYFEAPGTDLTMATAIGTLAFTESVPPLAVTPGDFRLFITENNNAANVLFESTTMSLVAGISNFLAILDGAGQGVAPINVQRVEFASVLLSDVNAQSGLRVINALSDQANRDIVVDGQFATPLFQDLPYGTVPAYATLAPGAPDITITPAGNPSVDELTAAVAIAPGRLHTIITAGDSTSGPLISSVIDDNRSIPGQSRLRILNGAHQFATTQFFIVTPGTDFTTTPPAASLVAPESTILQFVPGDYELTVFDFATQTTVASQPLTLADGGIHTIVTFNNVGGSTADIVVVND